MEYLFFRTELRVFFEKRRQRANDERRQALVIRSKLFGCSILRRCLCETRAPGRAPCSAQALVFLPVVTSKINFPVDFPRQKKKKRHIDCLRFISTDLM